MLRTQLLLTAFGCEVILKVGGVSCLEVPMKGISKGKGKGKVKVKVK